MKRFSITLLIATFSLLIIGFGGAATAAAAGECAETQLANGASESTAVTNCRAYEADAARYAAIAASYTNETNNVQRAFEADAARYTGLAALYTADEIAANCLGAGSTGMTTAALVSCMSDSVYQAANPELMTSHRFVVANGRAPAAPAPGDTQVARSRFLTNIEELGATQTDLATERGAIESQSSLNLYPNYAPGHLGH
jgi:hypothetical protein